MAEMTIPFTYHVDPTHRGRRLITWLSRGGKPAERVPFPSAVPTIPPCHWPRERRTSLAVNFDIIRYRKSQSGPRVLDLGCGGGERAITLATRSFNQVTGLDATKALVDLAIQRAVKWHVDVAFVCDDPYATPFETGSFDEVMILDGLFGRAATARSDVDLLREASPRHHLVIWI
jgi:SAM-dependent methyltransferase